MIGIDSKHSFTASALLTCALALGGCGSGDAPGTVQLGLVSAGGVSAQSLGVDPLHTSAPKLVSAIVTVQQIDVHAKGGGWTPIMTTPISVDLLNLDQQKMTMLGLGQLPQGQFDKLRMLLDDKGAFVVDAKNNKTVLEVPDSGVIKVIGNIDLDSCGAGTVILDFDPKITTASNDQCGDHSKCNNNGGSSGDHFVLRCRATIKTEEIHGQCSSDGGASGPPTGQQCGNGNTVCDPDQICKNGDCLDACFNVSCPTGSSCIKGQCVSNDPCAS
jgi:hypothetical protein